MGECEEIKSRVEGHHATLYGKEGTGGIVGCVKKKVSRSFLMWCVVVLISIFSTVAGLAYRAHSEGNRQRDKATESKISSMERESELRYLHRGEHVELERRTQKLETDTKYIKDGIKEIKQAIKELPNKLK